MIEFSATVINKMKNQEDKAIKVRIPCPKCSFIIIIKMDEKYVKELETKDISFPFPIIAMHTIMKPKREIHTLVAYIDKQLKCRHAEYLSGERVFITPYIVYNPSLLQMFCIK